MKYFPTETETGEKGSGQKYGLKQRWKKRCKGNEKPNYVYFNASMVTYTYLSLNSVLLCAVFTYRENQNIIINIKIRKLESYENTTF